LAAANEKGTLEVVAAPNGADEPEEPKLKGCALPAADDDRVTDGGGVASACSLRFGTD
jgi:hypothetical protein